MLRYHGANLVRPGFIGAVLLTLIVLVGLSPDRLLSWATAVRYQALFDEAGGLAVGNDVTITGIKVGTVSHTSVQNGYALVTFTLPGNIQIGSESTAHIRTGTLLGQRVLTVESAGTRLMRPNAVIPLSRTSSPYSLTEALSDLTTNAAGTDTQMLNQSLDTLSATIDRIAPELGPTFDGLTRLSRSLNSRNEPLRDLLKSASDVTGILSERSDKLNTLILNANDLLGVLAARRHAIVQLLANTSVLSKQLSGLVADNEQKLAPTLEKLNSVTAMLEKNRDNIGKILPRLAKFEVTQGETVASGPYYQAFVPNLQPMQLFQPFFDFYFGFRRGVDAGRPPDNAGPRALFPWPYNGIPGGSR